jgi:hypothetical protein
LLVLAFEGWAQCRLATDPDPSDEPRGVSGWTCAVAGEPDLDRILRLQPEGAVQRVPGPPIGVRVTSAAPGSPLAGARVRLLGDPVFDGRNGLANEDTREPIVPFHLRIEGDGVALERRHVDAAGRPVSTLPGRPTAAPERAATAIGVRTPEDRVRFRERRADALRTALAAATTQIDEAALRRRLRPFEAEAAERERRRQAGEPEAPAITTFMLGLALPYRITIDGEDGIVEDPSGALGPLDSHAPWQVQMAVGIWDADALCGWIEGALSVPQP